MASTKISILFLRIDGEGKKKKNIVSLHLGTYDNIFAKGYPRKNKEKKDNV